MLLWLMCPSYTFTHTCLSALSFKWHLLTHPLDSIFTPTHAHMSLAVLIISTQAGLWRVESFKDVIFLFDNHWSSIYSCDGKTWKNRWRWSPKAFFSIIIIIIIRFMLLSESEITQNNSNKKKLCVENSKIKPSF